MTDEQTIRDALDAAVEHPKYPAISAFAALDRLVAERDAAKALLDTEMALGEGWRKERLDALARAEAAEQERDVARGGCIALQLRLEDTERAWNLEVARAEAAEKERDEALDSVVLYVNERDRALARADNLAPYVARCATLEAALEHHTGLVARCATLEDALREIAEDMEGVLRGQAVNDAPYAASVIPQRVVLRARAALAAATRPAETGESLDDEAKQRYESDWATPPAEEPWGSMDLLTGGTAPPAEEDC